MPASEILTQLRQQLAVRFPSGPRGPGCALPSGVPALDAPAGGLPRGAVTELVCAAPSCGGQLCLGQLLAATRAARSRLALVDTTDCFDPWSHPADLLAHLVWVRCGGTGEALAVADLLVRDANLGLVCLDLRRAPEAELRRIPATTWYRLQRAVEPSDLVLVVVTPGATVPSAQVRFVLPEPQPFSALECERAALVDRLPAELRRQRLVAATA
ncbi:MAG: hypothetical protein B9S34_11450 [Opitutia bacterium Tous-C1TDCM]|nr:MAG: hypothetical protein B9S34_11450 [Opitutae bacterium Tous-C1TDCM]